MSDLTPEQTDMAADGTSDYPDDASHDEDVIRETLERAPSTAGGWRAAAEGLAALDRLAARVQTLEQALGRIQLNAVSWHGPPPDLGHVRALAVIAQWAEEAIVVPRAVVLEGAAE